MKEPQKQIFINFNMLSKWGLLAEINDKVLHQYGLSLTRTIDDGTSKGCICVADDVWAYTDEIISNNKQKLEAFKNNKNTLLEEYTTPPTFYKVGLVGYSSEDFDHSIAIRLIHEAFDKIKEEYTNVVLVSGLTNCGIPKLGYEAAKHTYKWLTMGITAKEALQYELFPVDKTEVIGDKFGDESEHFINYIDCLIKIGGGKQSEKELQMAKDKGIPIFEYELPRQQFIDVMNFEESFKEYMHKHRNGVRMASKALIAACPDLNTNLFKEAIEYHDASKFSEKEIDGYRWINVHHNFNIGYPSKEIENLTIDAWEHHKANNRHHPEYFEIMYDSLEQMNYFDIAEMVCDWKSMEQVSKSKGIESWYKKVYNKWNFNTQQREWITHFINILK